MGGLSVFHLLIILVIVLFFFGPRKLPELGKGLGEAIRGFKKGLEGGEIDVTESQKRDSLNAKAQEQEKQNEKTGEKNKDRADS